MQVYACMHVCVYVCGGGWLVVSYESLNLLPAGGAFKGMEAVTFSSLHVKSYLSASTTENIKYYLGIYFFARLLAECWSLAGALDVIF